MKIKMFWAALATTLVLSSCGSKEVTLCDCYKISAKYDSIEEAKKDTDEATIEKCESLMKEAKESDIENCETEG